MNDDTARQPDSNEEPVEETTESQSSSDNPTQEDPDDTEVSKESLADVFHHLTRAANIAAGIGESKINTLVDDLMTQGGKLSEKGQKATENARDRVRETKKSLEDRISEKVSSAIQRFNFATKDDISRLEGLIHDLEQQSGTSSEESSAPDTPQDGQ